MYRTIERNLDRLQALAACTDAQRQGRKVRIAVQDDGRWEVYEETTSSPPDHRHTT